MVTLSRVSTCDTTSLFLERKAHIRKEFVPLTGLICAFRSEDFLRWCLSPERNRAHNLFFLFPIVFGIDGSLHVHFKVIEILSTFSTHTWISKKRLTLSTSTASLRQPTVTSLKMVLVLNALMCVRLLGEKGQASS